MTTEDGIQMERGGQFRLARYLAAGTLGRAADAGAAVGLVLLCLERLDPAEGPLTSGGLLAAALTAPHLFGPLLARRLDARQDGRGLLAASFVAYAIFLAAAAALLGQAALWVAMVLVGLAGLCGPLLTGGLSSRLARLVPPDEHSRRRADGWDAVTYGVAGSLGPSAVAALAAGTSALVAVLGLAVMAVLGAVLVTTLRFRTVDEQRPASAMRVVDALRVLGRRGPLRRVTATTVATSFALGTLSVLAVTLAGRLGHPPAAAAVLTTAFGIGNLAGSLVVTARPLSGEPERLTVRWVLAIAGGLGLLAAAPTYPLTVGGFVLVGVLNAPFFAATLAARSSYAPGNARAQVFVAVAAFKVAAGSLGTAAAGLLTGAEPRAMLVAVAALVAASAGAAVVERSADPARPVPDLS